MPKAHYNLGVMYYNGMDCPQDYKEAVKWYTKAAEQGNAKAHYNFGVMYENGQGVPEDDKEVVKGAPSTTGCRCSVQPKADVRKRTRNNSRLQGSGQVVHQGRRAGVYVQNTLGYLYENGEGVPEDNREAVKWYTKSAEQGFANAQVNLGNRYYNGEGSARRLQRSGQVVYKVCRAGFAMLSSTLG